MLVDIGQPLEHLVAPGPDARLWKQAVTVLHQLVQVAVLRNMEKCVCGGKDGENKWV